MYGLKRFTCLAMALMVGCATALPQASTRGHYTIPYDDNQRQWANITSCTYHAMHGENGLAYNVRGWWTKDVDILLHGRLVVPDTNVGWWLVTKFQPTLRGKVAFLAQVSLFFFLS